MLQPLENRDFRFFRKFFFPKNPKIAIFKRLLHAFKFSYRAPKPLVRSYWSVRLIWDTFKPNSVLTGLPRGYQKCILFGETPCICWYFLCNSSSKCLFKLFKNWSINRSGLICILHTNLSIYLFPFYDITRQHIIPNCDQNQFLGTNYKSDRSNHKLSSVSG